MYKVQYAHDVLSKDVPKLKSANLLKQFFKEIEQIKLNPYIGKLLVGPLKANALFGLINNTESFTHLIILVLS